jgi:hypothetical protein
VRHHLLGVGVLGLEVGEDFGIVASIQPEERIVTNVPVLFEPLRDLLRFRWSLSQALSPI